MQVSLIAIAVAFAPGELRETQPIAHTESYPLTQLERGTLQLASDTTEPWPKTIP